MARKSPETTVEPLNVRERTTSELLSMIAGRQVVWSAGVSDLSRMTASELSKNLNVDQGSARKIQAALELAAREIALPKDVPIRSGNDVANYFRARLSMYDKESFWSLTLDQKHRPIDCHRISEGTLSMTPVHPREAYSKVLRDSAAAVIFVHNHPSGDPSPSRDDISLTRRLCEIGSLLGIRVLDHVVVGQEGFISLRDMGAVPENQTYAPMAAETAPETSSVKEPDPYVDLSEISDLSEGLRQKPVSEPGM
ncbi:JAB domain-containing protein [Leptospirillum ferriphilum]|uniref:JAB domain-containing protein n=1 Tax=Leptospirillum ferriphilum TaxID=178606 RepID=UPI0006B1B892|nr:JAB domain-containing protein [Leptospirillum ferriphilum]